MVFEWYIVVNIYIILNINKLCVYFVYKNVIIVYILNMY